MTETPLVFRPRYDAALLFAFPFFGVCIAVLGPDVAADPLASPMLTFSVTLFAVTLPFVATLLVREVRFEADHFVVRYYVRPAGRIAYAEVRDLSGLAVQTDRGQVGLVGMKNAGELLNNLAARLDAGQISGELVEAQRSAMLPMLLTLPLLFVLPYVFGALGVASKWLTLLTLGTWAVAYGASYSLYRWRQGGR